MANDLHVDKIQNTKNVYENIDSIITYQNIIKTRKGKPKVRTHKPIIA